MTTENSDPKAPLEPFIESSGGEPNASQEPEKIEAPKRRRGRPSLADSKLREEQIGASASAKEKKKPNKKVEYDNTSIENLARQIIGLHMIAAKVSGIEEFNLSEMEAQMLASSVIGVASQYDLAMSGKTGATLQLVGVAVMIYLPRFEILNKRRKSESFLQVEKSVNYS